MKPPKREYEKVKTDDFVNGVIESYDYEEKHIFKGPKGENEAPAIRFKFVVEGMKFPKYSRWMTFSFAKKGNIYLKYLTSLVENAKPDMDFDLDQLNGLKVKMLWKEDTNNADFQFLDSIRPLDGKKVVPLQNGSEEKIPF